MGGLGQKVWNIVHAVFGDLCGIGMIHARPHIPMAPPRGPIAKQQALLVACPYQVLERHSIEIFSVGGDRTEVAAECNVREFVGGRQP